MIKYIAIDHGAALSIVADATLQSVEFDNGMRLADVLRTRECVAPFSRIVRGHRVGSGLFLLAEGSEARLLVVDLDQVDPFNATDASQTLRIAQKLLRFAIKLWDGSKLSSNEWKIENSSRAVLFPFPFSSRSNYRITLERNADPKRTRKRGAGNHLLVFREGWDEGDGVAAVPGVGNLRLALKHVQDARSAVFSQRLQGTVDSSLQPISVTSLEQVDRPTIISHLGLTKWSEFLTTKQRAFVTRQPHHAERIEGPAGTGKTLCLVLKCLNTLSMADEAAAEHHAIFFAYSQATERSIRAVFEQNQQVPYSTYSRTEHATSVRITTLQEWCASMLGERIVSDAQFLDRDASDAKQLSLMYIEESLDEAMHADYSTHQPFLSPGLISFIDAESRVRISEMLQHEFAVMIKGRAAESFDNYKRLPYLRYGLPLKTPSDRGFVFAVFKRYSGKLQRLAQYDTDDIVLSSIGQLNTPIWRRKRRTEGYDSVFIDETHLFNINELSVFHYVVRTEDVFPISFSVDRSQASGDRAITNALLTEAILPPTEQEGLELELIPTAVSAVFRCSPDITAFALSVTAAGATLFTTFENPLESASSTFTLSDEAKAQRPQLLAFANDDELAKAALTRAELFARELNCSKADVLIVAFSGELLWKIEQYVHVANKPVELLKERGDIDVQSRARRNGRFVVSAPDYVGGLEFQGVVLVGVDDGRVPAVCDRSSVEGAHFEEYRAHNRLYVAITRAKYRVDVLISSVRGPSRILSNALASCYLERA